MELYAVGIRVALEDKHPGVILLRDHSFVGQRLGFVMPRIEGAFCPRGDPLFGGRVFLANLEFDIGG